MLLELLELLSLEFEDEFELELPELFDDELELELSELFEDEFELELSELFELELSELFELELSELFELELLELFPLELDEELELELLELFDWNAIFVPAAFMTGVSADPRVAGMAACAPPAASALTATMILSLLFMLLSFVRATASPPKGGAAMRCHAAECCGWMTGFGKLSKGSKSVRNIRKSSVYQSLTNIVRAIERVLNPT